MAKVFVSHAGADLALASEFHDWLIDQGHHVFLDQDLIHGMNAGEDWEQQLHERLRWADAVLCIVTSDFVKSTWCAAEVGISRSRGSRVLPVIAELDVTYPLLPSTQHISYAIDHVAALQTLAESLHRLDLAGAQGWGDDLNPFPGLRAFDADMRSVFFGRKGETNELATLLRSQAGQADAKVLLVVGPSGCGKSSMVRAGLLPLMAEEPGWWTLPPLVPGADPVGGLALQLAIAARQLKLAWTVTGTRKRLDRDDYALNLMAEELLLATPDPSRCNRLLLFVDQFEELLTQSDPSGRTRFRTLLRSALDGPLQVVGTVRPEFLQLLANDEAALPVKTFLLPSLQRESLRTVIEEPANRAGITIDRDLVDKLVDDTDSGDALPLLAFTLSRLAEGVARGGELTSARYVEIDGVQGALAQQAESALRDAEADGLARSEVISALLRLVTVDEQGAPTRKRLNQDVSEALKPFVNRRLVSTDTDNGSVVVQVAHEAFLTAWQPLSDAIKASASALRYQREVEQAAAEWAAQDQDKSHLWERGRLATAVNAVGAHLGHTNPLQGLSTPSPPAEAPGDQSTRRWRLWDRRVLLTDRVELNPQAREFLAASIRHDRRARRRTTTILASALVVAITAAVIANGQSGEARQQEQIAVSRQLVAQAEAARGSHPRTALLLGMAADHIRSDTQTRVSLFNTLINSEYAGTLAGLTDKVESVTFTPNGRTVATGSMTEVVLWDVSHPGKPKRLWSTLNGLAHATNPVAFTSDGSIMATGSDHNAVILWDVTHPEKPPKLLGSPLNSNYQPWSVAFVKKGDIMAIGDQEDRVTLWDVSKPGTPRLLSTPLRGSALKSSETPVAVNTLAFAPDGNTLAGGSDDGGTILWDVSNASIPKQLGSPILGDGPSSTAFTPDLRTLATHDPNGVVLLDVSNPGMPKWLAGPLKGTDVSSTATFAPGGHTMVISTGKTVSMWDVSNPREPKRLDLALNGHSGDVTSLAFAPDGHTLVTGSNDKTAILWNTSSQGQPKPVDVPLTGQSSRGYLAALTPDGRTLAILSENGLTPTIGIDEGPLSFWDISAPRKPSQLGLPLTSTATGPGLSTGTTDLTFSPGGRTLAIASGGGGATLWDVSERGQPKWRSIPTGNNTVTMMKFAPDGRTLVTGSLGNILTVWDVSHPGPPKQRGTSPPQSDIDVELMNELLNGFLTSGAFAPDGRTLATGSSDNTVILWDVTNPSSPKRLGHPLKGHGDVVTSVAFSSDGRTLATGSSDNTVILWDVSDKVHPRPLGSPLTGHTGVVSSIAFAPDRRTLATSDEHQVFLWDVSDPSRPTRLNSQLTDSRAPVTFAADGRTLTTGGMNAPAHFWDLTEFYDFRKHLLSQACKRMGQGLSSTEWAQYVSGLSYENACAN